MNTQAITVEIIVHAPLEKVWECWTKDEDIVNWAFASDDWETPASENDLRTGGRFKTVMAAKDKSASFDFTGVYTDVKDHELIEYTMDDGRQVKVEFALVDGGVNITETFEPESINSPEMQRSGWKSILDNFKKYVESK